MLKEKGFASVLVIVLICLVVGIYGLYFYLNSHQTPPSQPQNIPSSTKTPIATVSSQSLTPGKIMLQRQNSNNPETILSFPVSQESFDYVTSWDVANFKQWQNYLFYVNELPAENEPHQKQLIMYNLNDGQKKVIYDTNQYKPTSDKFWKAKGQGDAYYFYLPFAIVKDNLFLSVRTDGYDGDNPGPGATFFYPLPVTASAPQQIYDHAGEIVHNHGYYWLDDYVSPEAEGISTYIYNLLDPDSKKITPIGVQGNCDYAKDAPRECGVFIATLGNQMLWEQFSTSKAGDGHVQDVESIDLSNPTQKETVITAKQMPAEIDDISYFEPTNKLFMVGSKAFYFYDLTSKQLQKVVDFNAWNGDKFDLGKDTYSNPDVAPPVHITYLDKDVAYVPIGSTGGVTPNCSTYKFSTNTFKKDVNDPDKCWLNFKPNQNLINDDGPHYKSIEDRLRALKLPGNYKIVKE